MAQLYEFEGQQFSFPDDVTQQEVLSFLDQQFPYEAPPPKARRQPASAPSASGDDHVAVITVTLAMHLGKSPDEFRIVNISQP